MRLASVAKLRVTAGDEKLLSLVTFFAAAKKVTPAPGRGSANRPPRNQDSTKSEATNKRKNIHREAPEEPAPRA
ncbi:protein of unknown function (plasmid) [Caballeronia sp. S22]